jgi:hypothetical protein
LIASNVALEIGGGDFEHVHKSPGHIYCMRYIYCMVLSRVKFACQNVALWNSSIYDNISYITDI